MNKEIIEGNELIAKFHGWKHIPTPKEKGKGYWDFHKWGRAQYSSDAFQYHKSWDWLMPVMEKIGKEYNVRITWCADGGTKGFDVTYIDRPDIFDKELADFGGFGAITNTWKCAIKFITWYNAKFKIKS